MPTQALTRSHPSTAALAQLGDDARDYVSQAKAARTVRAYQTDWKDFEGWCSSHGLCALPAAPRTVGAYLTDQTKRLKVSTLERRVAAISQAHQLAGYESPTREASVRTLMSGIRRAKGTKTNGKRPVLTDDLRAMFKALPEGLLGARDRALLLVGFAGGFRRSELVGLDVADLEFKREGLVVSLKRSKTDQEGEGRKVGVPYGSNPDTCPVRSLQHWLQTADIEEGPVFRSVNRHGAVQPGRLTSQSVALVVKRYAEAAGKDPNSFSGHSLRAGLATQAAANGASERAIMDQTGHRSLKMVRRYIREGSLFRENAAALLGL